MVDIAQKIREIRKNLDLTQAEFAKAIGVSQGSVSKWEAGQEKPRLDAVSAIQQFSGLDLTTVRSEREHSYNRNGGLREITVIGSIQYNYGVEKLLWDAEDRFSITIPIPIDWWPIGLHARLVKGKDTWASYPVGTIVVIATDTPDEEIDDFPRHRHDLRPEHGDIVVCSVKKPSSLREVVLRRFVEYPDGTAAYWKLDNSKEPTTPPEPYDGHGWEDIKTDFLGVVALVVMPVANPIRLTFIPDE